MSLQAAQRFYYCKDDTGTRAGRARGLGPDGALTQLLWSKTSATPIRRYSARARSTSLASGWSTTPGATRLRRQSSFRARSYASSAPRRRARASARVGCRMARGQGGVGLPLCRRLSDTSGISRGLPLACPLAQLAPRPSGQGGTTAAPYSCPWPRTRACRPRCAEVRHPRHHRWPRTRGASRQRLHRRGSPARAAWRSIPRPVRAF
jgi:hypothetical protein